MEHRTASDGVAVLKGQSSEAITVAPLRRISSRLRPAFTFDANSAWPVIWYFPAVVAVNRLVLDEVEWMVSVSHRSESRVMTAAVPEVRAKAAVLKARAETSPYVE